MRVLFWVEPLIEMERPRFKQAWASDFSAGLMRTLRGSDGGRRHRLALAAGDAIAPECQAPAGTSVIAIDSRELQRSFGDASALELTCRMYDGSLEGEALDGPAEMIRSALGDFEPELVITHSPAPHVVRAFPEALILHREYSLFSRKPYPRTWYFDPCGMYRDSFLARFAAEIERWHAPGEDELERLRSFRGRCRALLKRRSPLRAFLADCRERFPTLLLFPLQFFGYYAIDANSPRANQLDLLLHVLERIPRDAGLIVTSHPEHNRLDRETVDWLRRRHPNLLHHPEIEATYAPSQYLLPEVDGLVCLSSALGLQALFWGVPLISVGPCYGTIADAALADQPAPPAETGEPAGRRPDQPALRSDPSPQSEPEPRDLREVLARGDTGREALVHYLLTRFSVPERFLHAPNWASAFLSRSLERWRAGGIDSGFFDEIVPADELFAHYEASLDKSIPHGCGTPSLERLHRVRRELEDRIARVPTGETAIEHGVEEAIASALTAPGPDVLTDARQSLDRAASHLERMAAWTRGNLRLLGEAPGAPADSPESPGGSHPPGSSTALEWSDLHGVLERISRTANEDPEAAATLYSKLSETPDLPPFIAAEVLLGTARLDRTRGEVVAAARGLLRALTCNPSAEKIFHELRDCLAQMPKGEAAGTTVSEPAAAESAAPRGTGDRFVLHLALSPPPADHRWRGWSELAPRFALPLRRVGHHPADWPDPAWPTADPSCSGSEAGVGAAANDPIHLRQLITSAALVICEDPAAARFCAACDEAALLLPRRSWLPLVANTRVEPIVAPTGHLLDLTPDQIASVVARACPGAIKGGQPTWRDTRP